MDEPGKTSEEDLKHESKPALNYKERRRINNPDRKRHGARNQARSKLFVKWLLQMFPNEIADDRPILDIAGGKGEVAARLCVCHSKKVIMVDPRPSDPLACFLSSVLNKIPLKWQQRLQQKEPEFLEKLFDKQFSQMVAYFDEAMLQQHPELHHAVEASSLIVGLHADGATEAIVNVALKYKKTFVVVPCCVFPNIFPQRMVHQNGELIPVRTVEAFCQYLLDKDVRFQCTQLPFEGRNTVIYWKGV
ncbi:hypothetical protein MPSEU_000902000 [Mayamaea pseudoterrestris]|nr:hypothetical protein MPSEU_000902000 [Mayamaea pseudoterrestris]